MKRATTAALLSVLAALPAPAQQVPPGCETVSPLPDPYVFILLDTSGSMNHAVECTQAEYDAGHCSYVCLDSSPSDECFAPLRSDEPGGKWIQVRQALHEVLSERDDVLYGFATYPNQDALAVKTRHWLYEATAIDPPGPGPYPPLGTREVFGPTWPCASGTNIGCTATTPADIPDPWEMNRVRQLPKGGSALNQVTTVYLRTVSNSLLRVQYAPLAGSTLGGPIQTTVTRHLCTNSTCTSSLFQGSLTVTWQPVSEYIGWDNYTGSSSLSEPYSFFPQSVALDAASANSCTGWEPNTDSAADAFTSGGLSYNLKRPTDASDPRGAFFTVGDMIPFDWNDPHKEDILARIAPNLAADPLAAPDFRTSALFQAQPLPGQPIRRLQDEAVRPLLPHGSSPLGNAVKNFRTWYNGWAAVAAAQDPDWACRRKHLLVIADDGGSCTGANPCYEAAMLRNQQFVKTSALFLGAPFLNCLANDGDGMSWASDTRQEIEDALRDFFDTVATTF